MAQAPTNSASEPLTRRKSLQLLLAFSITATAAGIIGPIIAYLWPQASGASYGGPTDVGGVADFAVGAGTIVSVNDKPVIVVNNKTGGLKAFSAICTHLGCIVQWDETKTAIHCPCHDGIFSPANGNVVSGPPPRPLTGYELAIKDGRVLVGKPTGELYGG